MKFMVYSTDGRSLELTGRKGGRTAKDVFGNQYERNGSNVWMRPWHSATPWSETPPSDEQIAAAKRVQAKRELREKLGLTYEDGRLLQAPLRHSSLQAYLEFMQHSVKLLEQYFEEGGYP